MQNLSIETEAVQMSIYCSIIRQILHRHKELSVNKMMVFAYLVKKEKYMYKKVYTAKNTTDVVYKALSLLAGDYEEYCNSVQYILKAIHLLLEAQKITLREGTLYDIPESILGNVIYEETSFLNKAIEASKKVSDRQFMKEVIANV